MFFYSYISLVRQNAALCGNGLIYDRNFLIRSPEKFLKGTHEKDQNVKKFSFYVFKSVVI